MVRDRLGLEGKRGKEREEAWEKRTTEVLQTDQKMENDRNR